MHEPVRGCIAYGRAQVQAAATSGCTPVGGWQPQPSLGTNHGDYVVSGDWMVGLTGCQPTI